MHSNFFSKKISFSLFSILFFAISILSFSCKSNQIVKVTYQIGAPSTRYSEDSSPDTLTLNFNGSVARLEDLNKVVTDKITITPPIEGEWKWANDTVLVFTPKTDWQLSTEYKFEFAEGLFADHVDVKGDHSFTTSGFNVYLQDAQFYIDPEDPSIKKVTCTVKASHPMEKEDLEKYISLEYEIYSNKPTPAKKDFKYALTFNKSATEAYIVSDNIPIPPKTSKMYINLKGGVKTTLNATSKDTDKRTVTVPGMTDFVKIRNISHTLVKNDKQNYDQVLVIETKGAISVEELSKHLSIYVLPKDRPAEQGWQFQENYHWYDNDYITEKVMSLSKKVSFTAVPTPEPASELNSFTFKAPTGRYLYIKLTGDLNFFGGYKLEDGDTEVIKVKDYPKELGILSEGTILSLSGSKKMAMYSRGVNKVYYSLARIMPKDVNHLVSMSNGDMKNFSFSSYRFTEDNIAEKEYSSYTIPDASEETISYFSYDFTKKLVPNPSKNLKNGLFIFQVSNKEISKSSNSYDDDDYYYSGSSRMNDKRFILVTDLGFFVKHNTDQTRDIFVQSISTGKPVPNAEVEIVGLNGNTIVKTTTDINGRATLPPTSSSDYYGEHKPTAYVVKTANDLSFMPYSENGRTLDYSNYDIGGEYGAADPNKISAFMFSDRGMYRPGDTIHLGLIAKAGDWNINLANLTLECEVIDPKSSVTFSKQIKLNSSGFDEITFSTQDYSPTGVYNANLYLLKQYKDRTERNFLTSTTVKVEEFLPDTLKLTTNFSPLPNDGWITPGKLEGHATLKNLFGTPAAGNDIKAQISLTPGFPSLRKYSDYRFSDPLNRGKTFTEFLGTVQTDEKGEASFPIDTKKFEKATYRLDFYVEGFEKGSGRSVSQESSVYVSPLEYLIGYKADGSLSYINKNSVRKLKFIAINQNLDKIDLSDITFQLEEVKYVSTLVKQPNGLYKYQSVKKTYPVSSQKMTISKAGTDFILPSKNAGEYKLTLIDKKGLIFNTINYTIIGAQNITRSLTRTAELEISLEKSDIKAGGTAKLFIKAPYAGSGLITIERDKVYNCKWFTTDTLSTEQVIEIPANLEGNGYINVMFTRSTKSDEIFMSPFCYGAVPFSIDKENRTNNIKLTVPDEIKSGTDLTINYSSSDSGKIVIYAVDEGILQLAGYTTPNPLNYFFKKRALEVTTSQILDLVLPEYEILKTMSATGGGAGMDELSRNLNPFKRKQNAPVAFWSGIVDTGKETRSVKFRVPDYFNGSIRVMAIAVSKDKIGRAETSTLSRNTFIISPNAPLAAVPGDEFDVSVTVTNNHKGSGANAKVTLNATPSKHLEIVGTKKVTLTIPEGKDATVSYKVRAKNILGGAELKFVASDEKESSTLSSTLSVRPSMPYQMWVTSGKANAKSPEIDVNHKLYDEFAKREVAVSNVPTSFLDGLNFYLAEYPYGCSEQVTSKAYPYIFPDFLKAGGKTQKDAQDMINQTVGILQSRMKSDGTIGYWTTSSPTDYQVTLYVAEFITDARNHGYYIPNNFYNKLKQTVTNIANRGSYDNYDMYLRAYAIFILTKGEMVTTAYIEDFEDDITRKNYEATDYEGLYLAGSYAILKQNKKANSILAKIKREKTFDSSWNYNNSLHYVATYIDIIASYFPERIKDIKSTEVDNLCNYLTFSYYNTYSTAAAIRAFESYAYTDKAEVYKALELNGKVSTPITIAGNPVLKGNFTSNAQKVQFTCDKTLPMYYQVTQAGFETTIPSTQIKDGLEVTREYCTLEGEPLTEVKVGDDVMVRISFRCPQGSMRNIAFVDMQPAGLEADTESIRKFRDSRWTPDYVDVREDRVIIYATVTDSIRTFTYKAKAINSGKFIVPPMFAESMYNKDIRAITPCSPITIAPAK